MVSAVPAPSVSRDHFGRLPDGRPVERIRFRSRSGCEACIITYGAAVQALIVPDRDGRLADIVLGHDDIAGYVAHRRFFGASVGRYANRIAGGTFMLDGTRHQLTINDGRNSLHGGSDGFDRKLWSVMAIEDGVSPSVTLSHVSLPSDDGYPGTLRVMVTYSWIEASALHITFKATTDRPTIVNLTHHGFFNLAGVTTSGDVLDHHLMIEADDFLPVDHHAIPLGAPVPVANTPFDFRNACTIGARIRQSHPQLETSRGYDHNFCLRDGRVPTPRLAARLSHVASGRVMDLLTDQPGLQFYSGNFLDGSAAGKSGRSYRQSDGLCLEPQGWPDAPNRPDYPSARLDPGEPYSSRSIYRFSTL